MSTALALDPLRRFEMIYGYWLPHLEKYDKLCLVYAYDSSGGLSRVVYGHVWGGCFSIVKITGGVIVVVRVFVLQQRVLSIFIKNVNCWVCLLRSLASCWVCTSIVGCSYRACLLRLVPGTLRALTITNSNVWCYSDHCSW